MLSNQDVAQRFVDIADMMELLGEDRFKSQAYRRAGETLAALPLSLHDYYTRHALQEIPGVGQAISAKIGELFETGQIQFYERLHVKVPDGVVDVMRIPGVGPKTAWRLFQELGIISLESLEAAASSGQIRTLKGFGAKLEERILQGLRQQANAPDRFLLGEALPLAHQILSTFRGAAPSLAACEVAGSVRRASPTIGDLDLVAAAEDLEATLDLFISLPQIAAVEVRDGRRVDVRLHNGKTCSLYVTMPDVWGAALVMWTGSVAHRERLQHLAVERGLSLREDGLWRGSEYLPTPLEQDVYEALGLPFIEPELREDWGEIEAALAGTLPELLLASDMRSDLHTHTSWSDGSGSVAEVAEAALQRGYSYYAITDHGFYMGMVNGLDAARLKAQRVEIDAVNEDMQRRGVDFRLLQGTEVDILPDGTLALPDEVLATLDWVVASPHVSLRQDRQTATDRLIRAISNPYVDCIGHPTGRLLLRREGAELDMEAVLDAAASQGVILEIDGAYPRLDLDARHVKRALELGIKIAVDSDAHHPHDLAGIDYGVLTARRGWATRADVINTWSWDEIEAYRMSRRKKHSRH